MCSGNVCLFIWSLVIYLNYIDKYLFTSLSTITMAMSPDKSWYDNPCDILFVDQTCCFIALCTTKYSNHSKRWIYPDLWYSQAFKVPGTDLQLELLMIDTVVLEGISFDQEYCDKYDLTECLIQPQGPDDAELAQNQVNVHFSSTVQFCIILD